MSKSAGTAIILYLSVGVKKIIRQIPKIISRLEPSIILFFNPKIGKYNAASGNIEGNVNIGPTLPPQRKGRLPQYPHDKLVILQNKMDEYL